jgi:folate-binding Fe-S cluster repair protein YgfZ
MSNATELVSAQVLDWSVITARGPESETYLQGQLSQDLTGIGDGGRWSLLLAPDSVIISTLFVTAVDDGFDLVVPRGLASNAYARLRRFLLRSKCVLEVHEIDNGPFASVDDQIAAAWPGENEIATSLTPHTFGRRFVDATISFTKGCFTGQELVGRLDARGSSVPWRFVHVDAPTRELADAFLHSKGPDGPQGVTSAHSGAGSFTGLGIAHRTLLGATSTSEGVRVLEVE